MKRIFLLALLSSFSGFAFTGILSAQDASTPPENLPAEQSLTVDADDPGIGILDQATEAKLRANTILDLGQVIFLCQQAKKTGLTGENLKYCNQLLASTQLQRGLFLTQSVLTPQNVPDDWEIRRERALADLEEAVMIIKDQPAAHLRIAQLNLLPDGDETRAKAALNLAVQTAKNEPELQLLAIGLLAKLETEPEKREAILASAAKDGNPQVKLLHAVALLELKRDNEAMNVLHQMIETESGNDGLQASIVAELIRFGQFESAMKILDLLRDRVPEGRDAEERKNRIDLTKAELYSRTAQHEEALKLLGTLHQRFQGNDDLMVSLLLLRSTVHLAMDNMSEALTDVESADTMRPAMPLILELKYTILMEQMKWDEALEVTKKLRSLEPENRRTRIQEIHVLSELGRYDDALKVAQELRKEFPEEPQWVMVLIELYTKQKAYDEALALADEQLKKLPDDTRWILIKTQIYSEQKKWDEALALAEEQLKKHPDDTQWILIKTQIYSEQEKWDEALALAEEQLKNSPEELRWILAKTQIYSVQKKWDDAVSWLESCLQKNPDSPELNVILIGVLSDRKSFKAAKERLQSLLAKEPDNVRLLGMDSQLSISLGLHHEAITVLTKVIELDPKDYTSINNLSWLLSTSPIDSLRNGRRALELAERASELSRYQQAFVLSTLAAAHAELGDFAKAIEWSQKGAELAKKDQNTTEEKRQELLDHFQKELDSFNRNEPFRELLEEEE